MGSLPSMNSHVSIQIVILSEGFLAIVTAVGVLPCMNSHVSIPIMISSEGLLAKVTAVEFLPCMNSHVYIQTRRLAAKKSGGLTSTVPK